MFQPCYPFEPCILCLNSIDPSNGWLFPMLEQPLFLLPYFCTCIASIISLPPSSSSLNARMTLGLLTGPNSHTWHSRRLGEQSIQLRQEQWPRPAQLPQPLHLPLCCPFLWRLGSKYTTTSSLLQIFTPFVLNVRLVGIDPMPILPTQHSSSNQMHTSRLSTFSTLDLPKATIHSF